MLTLYLSTSSDLSWLGLTVALGVVGSLGAFCGPRSRRLLVALLVVGVLAYGASVASAVPFNCPPLWRALGIC